jgi:hypothetical protein
LWVGLLDSLEPGKRSVIVEVVKVFVRLAGLRSKVDGVRVGGGVVGIGGRRACQEKSKREGKDGYAAFYDASPGAGTVSWIALRSNIAFPLR